MFLLTVSELGNLVEASIPSNVLYELFVINCYCSVFVAAATVVTAAGSAAHWIVRCWQVADLFSRMFSSSD